LDDTDARVRRRRAGRGLGIERTRTDLGDDAAIVIVMDACVRAGKGQIAASACQMMGQTCTRRTVIHAAGWIYNLL
jgi:hypothetical protein